MFLLRRVGPLFAHHVFLWVTCWKAAVTGDTCLPRLDFKVLFTKTSISVYGSSSHRLITQCFREVYRKFLFELSAPCLHLDLSYWTFYDAKFFFWLPWPYCQHFNKTFHLWINISIFVLKADFHLFIALLSEKYYTVTKSSIRYETLL